jgi:squalene-hopene/tetraprenyl-beta-curcumene cyclase
MSPLEGAVCEADPPALPRGVEAAQGWLLGAQRPDGHWCGELEGDTILESEYVIVLHFLGRLADPRLAKLARYLRGKQLPEGGWAIYPGGPPEVSGSVKAYLALKLAGDDPEAPHMRRARERIRELGGIDACNSFTKIYLALCGEYDWWRCPAVPPEMILLPRWLYFNLYEISSWSRAIVVPLSVVWAVRPVRPLPAGKGVGELRAAAPARPAGRLGPSGADGHRPRLGDAANFWRAFFLLLDRGLKLGEKAPFGMARPLRRRALARAEAWIVERLADSDGLGAIFPPIVNTIFALRCLGYAKDHPLVAAQVAELEKLEIEEEGSLRLQPCFSSVWDTAIAVHALADSGLPGLHPALAQARRWLLDREIRQGGDWSVKAPGAVPGGWCFEYRNPFYPDCDDTAEVLTALASCGGAAGTDGGRAGGGDASEPAVQRGLAWLLAMQNVDGGWGAFDRGCDKEILTHVPFADHNALLDPSTADVTGRVLDCLGRLGLGAGRPEVARALAWLRAQQEEDGSWYGRWGCNYIYGTWLALRGLARHGEIAHEPWCRRATAWLISCQNPDGGWGESPLSYDDPAQKGRGESTAAQTAWALMGLFGAGVFGGRPVERGVDFLLRCQRPDGSWRDEPWTATGFPRVFYLRYHLYATYFPLMALSEYRRETEREPDRGYQREFQPEHEREREGERDRRREPERPRHGMDPRHQALGFPLEVGARRPDEGAAR